MTNKLIKKIETVFTSRNIRIYALFIALLLALPSLTSGLFLDDYRQRTIMLKMENANPFEFYRVGTPMTDNDIERGYFPWWMHPESRLEFFRPIAQWLMELDYALWPENPPLMHFHSILWYVALVFVASIIYRKFMPHPLGFGLAIIMFASDFGHGAAVAWLANRNAMVAMIFSLLALLFYSREQWRWQILGALFFTLSLACAEAALAITGYFFAHEVFLSKQPWRQRILRLIPYAAISVLWLLFWRIKGYGSAGPGFYIDPASDLQGFISNLVFRAPSFVVGELLSTPIELFALLGHTPLRMPTLLVVLALCAGLIKLLWPVLRASARARFYLLGMCIAALPISGSEPVSRSLWYVGFGGVGLLALWFEYFCNPASKPTKVFSVFAVILLFLHFVASPILFLISTSVTPYLDNYMDSSTVQLPNHRSEKLNVLVLSSLNGELNIMFPLQKDEALAIGPSSKVPEPSIKKLRQLTTGANEFAIERPAENVIIVRNENGFSNMRKGVWGFDKGETVILSDVKITVLDVTPNREAKAIEYRFDPGVLSTYEVIEWSGDKFIPSQLPAIGTTRHIKDAPVSDNESR